MFPCRHCIRTDHTSARAKFGHQRVRPGPRPSLQLSTEVKQRVECTGTTIQHCHGHGSTLQRGRTWPASNRAITYTRSCKENIPVLKMDALHTHTMQLSAAGFDEQLPALSRGVLTSACSMHKIVVLGAFNCESVLHLHYVEAHGGKLPLI